MTNWTEKVVAVTGGSSGLGRDVVEAFAAAGAHVVAIARDEERLRRAREEWQSAGLSVVTQRADVLVDRQLEQAVDACCEQFGRLDAFVNCVGQSARGRAVETTVEEFQRLWEANFLSVVRGSQVAIPHLVESQGHLVNIGSLASKSAGRFLGAYPATKFPVAAYTAQLRMELGPQGVHVMLVCPGPIRRDDAGARYRDQASGLPDGAQQPGGGVKLKGIDGSWLARRMIRGCERREPELVIPAKARLLFAISQLSPRWGDWILGKMTKGQ